MIGAPEIGAPKVWRLRFFPALLMSVPACALLIVNTFAWRDGHDLSSRRLTRRYWEDLTIAAADQNRGAPTKAPVEMGSREGQALRGDIQRFLTKTVTAEGMKAWQFWRTVPLKPYLQRERVYGRPSDDGGRAALLTIGFRILGGVSPFLPLWLGTLACLPVLAWAGWEMQDAGHKVAGAAFPLVFASSPYVVEVLTLPYSAVGFYLIGLLALVPITVYAVRGRSGSPRLLFLRCCGVGLCFAVCALCRGGTVLLLPGFALAILLAVARVYPATASRRRWAAAAALGLFILPYAMLRPAGHHEIWLGVWEGLGDFDRVKGHVWSDRAAKDVLIKERVHVPLDSPVWADAMDNEPIFRRLVLEDIRADPLWYATILGKRVLATTSQWKLWPYGPRDGVSMRAVGSRNEGDLDDYYRMTTTADWFGVGGGQRELPLLFLLLPTVLLFLLWVALTLLRRPAGENLRRHLGSLLAVVACPALAALILPVLITTAGGLETQAFVLVYFLGAAFAVEEFVRLAAPALVEARGTQWRPRSPPV